MKNSLDQFDIYLQKKPKRFKAIEDLKSAISALFIEAESLGNGEVKQRLSLEICKMLVMDESKGLEFFGRFHKKYLQQQVGDPLISILVTSYNTGEYIEACIKTLLLQTYQNVEIILVDDGSADDTVNILKAIPDKRIRLFEFNENKGRVASLNYGLSECKGDYIALMDSDDLAAPLRIEKLYNYLIANKLDAVSSQLVEFDERKNYSISNFSTDVKTLKVKMLFYNSAPHAATLFKAETLKATSYREGFDFAEDYEMLSRYSMKYNLGLINEPLYIYRRRTDSLTGIRNRDQSFSSQKKIIREIFDHYLFKISDAELDLHFSLEKNIQQPFIREKKELIKINRWIRKVIHSNQQANVFDQAILKRVLYNNYWSTYYYNNADLRGTGTAISLFNFQNVQMSLLMLKEGLKANIGRIMRKFVNK